MTRRVAPARDARPRDPGGAPGDRRQRRSPLAPASSASSEVSTTLRPDSTASSTASRTAATGVRLRRAAAAVTSHPRRPRHPPAGGLRRAAARHREHRPDGVQRSSRGIRAVAGPSERPPSAVAEPARADREDAAAGQRRDRRADERDVRRRSRASSTSAASERVQPPRECGRVVAVCRERHAPDRQVGLPPRVHGEVGLGHRRRPDACDIVGWRSRRYTTPPSAAKWWPNTVYRPKSGWANSIGTDARPNDLARRAR